MIHNYDVILFDADDTLFHFDTYRGMQHMFTKLGADFSERDYHDFITINKPLWLNYQLGKITANDIQTLRFEEWSSRFNLSAVELNEHFLTSMTDITEPLDGAIDLLNHLKGKVKLGIVTNGFTQMQRIRLERTGLQDHFDVLIIAEEVGLAKPDPAIFDLTLARLNHTARDRVLMVGDTLESDVLGGLNAGIHTCWLNLHQKAAPEHITPHFEVNSLSALDTLLHLPPH